MNITGIATAVALIASNIIPGTEGTPAQSFSDVKITGNIFYYDADKKPAKTSMSKIILGVGGYQIVDLTITICGLHGENCELFSCR
jgi:hypothetical protein